MALSHFFSLGYGSLAAEAASAIFVEIFFPLSGFVLAQQIMLCRDRPANLPTFYARRWMRTLPPYLIAMSAVALLMGALGSRDYLLALGFMQSMTPALQEAAFYPIAWSLAIEEYFYLVFPIVVMLAPRGGLLRACLLFIAAFQLARIGYAVVGDPQFLRIGTWLRLDAIAFGFVLALYWRTRMPLAIALALSTIAALATAGAATWILLAPDSAAVRLLFVNTATLLGLLLVKTFHDGDRVLVGSRPAAKAAVFLGQISYSVYLFHLPILMLVRSASGLHGASAFAVYVAATVGFCWLFFLLVEKPILAARPRFDAARPGAVPSRNVTPLASSPFGNRASDA